MKNRNRLASILVASIIPIVLASFPATAQDRRNALGSTTMREPNVPSPNLYADRIKLKVTLGSLPGAADPASSWEGSYQVYFVPENDYYSVLDGMSAGGQSLSASQFTHKRLLVEGTIKKTGLASAQDRTIWRNDIDFKKSVPVPEQTKFGRLLTSYSVKIYDAVLKMPLYRSGVFVTYVFERPADGSANVASRQNLYLSFSVTPQGTLSYSQLPTQ